MRSSFTGIEMAKRSLFTQQAALTTTAHNIANANTAGYSRQVVNMVAAKPLEAVGMMHSTVPGQMGQSVEFDSITRIREQFLDDQFHNSNKDLGDWNIRKDTMDKLEAIVNEPSDSGVRTTIEGFWNSWQELSKTPENLTARVLVKERALALTDALNNTSQKLQDLSNDLTKNIDTKATQANSILGTVANLNEQIYRVEGLGDRANDLRDQRDLLMDNLSKIVNISYTEDSAGYNVKLGNVQLVTGNTVDTQLSAASFATAAASGDLSSGEVKGMLISRDQKVADLQYQLDSMAKVLANGDMKVTLPAGTVVQAGTVINGVAVTGRTTLATDTEITVKGFNGLHALGYGNSVPAKSGIPFFTLKPGTTDWNAKNITINPNILSNVGNVASSMRTYIDTDGVEKVVKGNNDLALLAGSASQQKFNFDADGTGKTVLNDGTFSEFFQSLVGEIGVQSEEATRQQTNNQALIDQIDSRRQSVSGVSLDEEMANMIKFQHAYNAAARALTTFDQMLDKVINSMGVVGR